MKLIYNLLLPLLVLCMTTVIAFSQDTVAHYTFDGNALDQSGFGNDALICGALLTQDRFGVANRAFAFDGVQSFLQAANADQLQTPTTSVSFWIKVAELPAQGEVFILSHGGWQERWKISLPGHGKPVWSTKRENGNSDMDSGDSTNALKIGEWAHVVTVHDGTKNLIYLNGTLAAEKDVVGDLNTTIHPLGMGYDPIGGSLFFKGSLDEVMIFGGALSAQQISDLYDDQNTATTIEEGLVASYAFSGNLSDGSVFSNHGRGVDLTPTTDRFGFGASAYSFNGTSSQITISNSAQLNSDATTVSFWINARTLPGQGETYVASFGGWQERWKISLPAHGKLVWSTNGETGNSDVDAGDSTNALVPGLWTHAVMVHDGAKDKIFLNGVLVNERDAIGNLNSTIHPFGLGYNPVDGGNYFDGSLDEVQVYNYALSDAEIADLYADQSMSPATPVELVADFSFSGNAEDATQFGNNGIVNGAIPTTDRFGYGNNAYQFSGAEHIDVPNSIQYNSDYTSVGFWVNVDTLPAQGEIYLMSFGGWQERWKISLPSHGKPVWSTKGENGNSDMDSGDGNELQTGAWTYLTFVHGQTQDKIYVNGSLAASKDVGGTLNTTRHTLGIGYNPIDGGNYFIGKMDDIQIYNVELSDQQIADLYEAQSIQEIITDSLVAYYPFSGNARDITPFNNHASGSALPGPDRFGKVNQAYSFNGTDSELTAQNSVQLNSPKTSVSFWINVKELPASGESYLLSFGGWQERWKISLPGHGKPVWSTNGENGNSDMDSGDGNELQIGTWTHVVMVHDSLENKIYFDGVSVAEKEVIGDLNSTVHDLGIGYNIVDGGSYFNGLLDEIQIYNIALSDQQIADLYAEQSQAPDSTDTEAPSAPLDLIGNVSFTTVSLSWQPSTDNVAVAGYNVWQDSTKIQTTSATNAIAADLQALTTFTFAVTAVDESGNESAATTVVVTTGVEEAPDTIPPSTPGNLEAMAGSNSIGLSWDPSTDNQAVAGYIVYVDGVLYDSLSASGTSIVITGLESETLYTFEVQAFDLAGNLSEFAEITISTSAPVDAGEDGLVAHYPFEGNADDATPYLNHGVIAGDVLFEEVPDRGGMAIKFDGDQDSVLAPNAVQLNSDYTTVSFWVRVDDQNLQDAEAYILDFGHWDQRWKVSLPQHLKIVWTTNSKNAQFDNAISNMDTRDGNELIKGFWWYITMVHDGVDDIIYLDGNEVNRQPAPGTLNSTGRELGMGSNPVEGGQYFNGALDELKIYNRALTGDEVKKLFTSGTTGLKDLVGKLDGLVELLYPNPTSSEVIVNHQFKGDQPLLVRVFDLSGRQMDAVKFNAIDLTSKQIRVDVANYPSGLYSLNFVLGGQNLGAVPFMKK